MGFKEGHILKRNEAAEILKRKLNIWTNEEILAFNVLFDFEPKTLKREPQNSSKQQCKKGK